jgi:hypothetical protein
MRWIRLLLRPSPRPCARDPRGGVRARRIRALRERLVCDARLTGTAALAIAEELQELEELELPEPQQSLHYWRGFI